MGDQTTVGTRLDEGRYEHGRAWWELFARDMGCVYNGHLVRLVQYVLKLYVLYIGLCMAHSFFGGVLLNAMINGRLVG